MNRFLWLLILAVVCCVASWCAGEESIPRGKILDRNGVVLASNDSDGKRVFPFGAAAAHTLGYAKGSGIEFSQSTQLSRGEDVRLTLDIRVQLAAEYAMRRIGQGAAIVTKPDTGEVLALVTVPSFDPNAFSPNLTMELFNGLYRDKTNPLVNRAVVTAYPPGSIFKIVTALTLSKNDWPKCDCAGGIDYEGRRFLCWNRTGHGELDLRGALGQSCNIFFSELAKGVGIDEIGRVAKLMGFGSKTGIPLQNESAGLVPDSETRKEKFGNAWSNVDTANVAIGQGCVTATPLQFVGAIGVIANEGIYVQPNLLLGSEPESLDLTKNAKNCATVGRT